MSNPLWDLVVAERESTVEFLADLTASQWETPSLCVGWRVRDVAAHLLVDAPLSELGAPRVLAKMIDWRFDVHAANTWWVDHNREVATSSILERLRADVRPGTISRLLGAPSQLRAAVIHADDMRHPLGQSTTPPAVTMRAALEVSLTRAGSVNVGTRERADGLRLIASDLDWERGQGPEVTGSALSILMAIAGRPAALTNLAGDGVDVLRRRP